ncbi:MAG: glycosyltransferase family 4 protein [bacterium]|nr:glycosyltransferase family 4 protein [bacterium]
MNILILTYQGDPAGSTQSVMFLCRGLAAHGHNVWLGCREESLIHRELRDSDVKLAPMRFGRYGGPAVPEIVRLCREENIDIINAQSSKDRYAAMRARFLHGVTARVVFTRRQMPSSSRLSGLIASLGAHRIIAVSRAVADGLAARWVRRSLLEVVHNGTPAEKYEGITDTEVTALRERLGIEPGAVVIGCLARRKRQDVLLRACPLLPAEATILIVGPGRRPEWDAIIEEIKPRQRIIFLGHETRILPFYRLLTVCVLPSLLEGLSQMILEAMALEVPVVASAWGGNGELIEDGKNGLLFSATDHVDLAAKVNRLLEDNDLYGRLRTAGRSRALVDFSVERTVRNTAECFERLLTKDQSS